LPPLLGSRHNRACPEPAAAGEGSHHNTGLEPGESEIPVTVSWTSELRQAFAALRAGAPARVSFAARDDRVGDVGREFNRLADALARCGPGGLTREQAHSLRNRLAGVLAVLHVLRVTGEVTTEEEETLAHALADAKELDAQLRAG